MVLDMTTGSPLKRVLKFFFPVLLSQLLQQLYSTVDSLIVSQYLGVDAFAGVSSTGSLNFLILGTAFGICSGFAIPVSQRFGAGDIRNMRRYFANSLLLTGVIAIGLGLATGLLSPQILKWTATPDDIFREIHRIETEHRWLKDRHIQGVADPAIWDASHGVSIAETAEKYRVYFEPGDHKRLPGWMQVHYRLQFGENGIPMLYVFSGCKAFIRTIPLLVYDQHRPEDIDTSGEDHVYDETRYFLMSRPIAPRARAAGKKAKGFDPLAE